MKGIQCTIIAMLTASMFLSLSSPADAKRAYKIIMMVGDVKIESGGATATAAVNQVLEGGEVIITGAGSIADISMGGNGYMRVQENTRVKIAALAKAAGDPDVDMESGGVLVFLSKLLKSNKYEVKSRTQVASVRGTIFQVTGDRDESQLDVFAGSVVSSPVEDGIVQRQIVQMVSEGQSLNLTKLLVADVLAKKKKLTLSALRSEIKEAFMKQALQIRESPEFKKYGGRELKKQINERIEKIKQELKDKKLDTKSLKEQLKNKKEELLKDREKMIRELKGK
ncbi:MAG: FecR domain-containing protein [Spirochaetes bacterium]|nr:FecR domain-containing protein [Spirochaetota bacterium]